jgi:hypothetical protein
MPMTAAEARALTDQAKQRVDQASALAESAVALVEKVIASGGHTELGYASPGQYLRAEFDVAALQFTPDERREMALMLVRNGVSKRGTAQLLGVSEPTIRRDLGNASPDALPDRVETSDGRTFPFTKPTPAADASHVADAEIVDDPPSDEGLLDGDDWVQPAGPGFEQAVTPPAKPKRRPLPEAFADTAHDLVRITERLDRLRDDDRFIRNRPQTHHRAPEIVRALESVAQLAVDMDLPSAQTTEEARRWWATSLHNISDALTDVANSLEQEQS